MSDEITEIDPQKWFQARAWAISGNHLAGIDDDGSNVTTNATRIVMPSSTEEVANLVKSHPTGQPIAVVCGGHEGSNIALLASHDALVLDVKNMNTISMDLERNRVTIAAGVLAKDVVYALRDVNKALPLGTGADVGVLGFLLNGGLSGYMSRRLGLLAQRVLRMIVVDAEGNILELSREDTASDTNDKKGLFVAMLGAGSALGIVTEVTLELADDSCVQKGMQYVFVGDDEKLMQFVRFSLTFVRSSVLPNDAVSMEIVVTGNNAVVITIVFYDTFASEELDQFSSPLCEYALNDLNIELAATSKWDTWFEVASALWPVIEAISKDGDETFTPAYLQHCCGTKTAPTGADLEFVATTWVGEAPLAEAKQTIVEVRTLGGAISLLPSVPSGNCHHDFFVDLVVLYRPTLKSKEERQLIADRTSAIVSKSRGYPNLTVDFSGTHSQLDDPSTAVQAKDIFGNIDMANLVQAWKHKLDPENRFRFHPFAKILP